jgi:hypothetical protein
MSLLKTGNDRISDGDVRSSDLTTKRAIVALFAGRRSAQVLAGAFATLAVARVALGGPPGRGDVIVIAVTIAITGTVEWVIHKYLLHAPLDSWATRTLGTGSGHHRHHLDPTDIEWLLLRGLDAGVFVTAFGAFTAMWAVPLLWITGSSIVGGFLTAWAVAAAGLIHYEWVHLMVHTRYRPRTRFYKALARNHRLHHFRNERYWLGVTSNTGDRLLGTLPKHKSDVPLSDTARTLVHVVSDTA